MIYVKIAIIFGGPYVISYLFAFLDPDQYIIIDDELTFEEADKECNAAGTNMYEPDEMTNDEVLELASTKGINQFWIGVRNISGHLVLASDNTSILWSHTKPKPQDTNCADNACFILGKEGGSQPTTTFDFSFWSGKCCSTKKYGAVCDKKLRKFSRLFFLRFVTMDA